MNKLLITILAAGLLTVAVPMAAADQTKSDCEDSVTYDDDGNPGTPTKTGPQPWIGYRTTDAIREIAEPASGGRAKPCEGEHWDGQDNVQPGQNPGTSASCTKGQTMVTPDAKNAFVGSCMNADPNQGAADPISGNGQPLTFRASYKEGNKNHQAYVGTNIALVGRAVVYVGECQAGGQGFEGASSCEGARGSQRVGTYVRDDTPENQLAKVVSASGITKGHAGEADCTQSTYQSGAYQNSKDLCGRDNTAITVELLP